MMRHIQTHSGKAGGMEIAAFLADDTNKNRSVDRATGTPRSLSRVDPGHAYYEGYLTPKLQRSPNALSRLHAKANFRGCPTGRRESGSHRRKCFMEREECAGIFLIVLKREDLSDISWWRGSCFHIELRLATVASGPLFDGGKTRVGSRGWNRCFSLFITRATSNSLPPLTR